MTITNITKTKQGYYALFDEDDTFLFSIDDETLVRNNLRIGCRLDDAALDALRSQSNTRKARDKAMDYLARRDHASGELYTKLCEKFNEHDAAFAVAEMQRMGFLDDGRYAVRRAQALAQKNKSPREIAFQLRAKGVDRALIDEALAQLETAPEDACYALIQKSYWRKLQDGQTDKVAAALARRGFGYSAIRQAIARSLATDDEEDTWL